MGFMNLGNLEITYKECCKKYGTDNVFLTVYKSGKTDLPIGYNTKNGTCKDMSFKQFVDYVLKNSCKDLDFCVNTNIGTKVFGRN